MKQLFSSSQLRHHVSRLGPSTPIAVKATTKVRDAVHIMKENGIGCVLVVDDDRLVGIVSERDILTKVLAKGDEIADSATSTIMTADPVSLQDDDTVAFALNKMSVGSFRHIPILDASQKPVGIISAKDIFRYLVS